MGSDDRTGRPVIRHKIMTEMTKHPGVPVWLGQLQEATGETDHRRIQAALVWLSKDPANGITVHTRGQAWVYAPARVSEASRELLEVIGRSKKDGSMVCEGEDGTLYRAVPIN